MGAWVYGGKGGTCMCERTMASRLLRVARVVDNARRLHSTGTAPRALGQGPRSVQTPWHQGCPSPVQLGGDHTRPRLAQHLHHGVVGGQGEDRRLACTKQPKGKGVRGRACTKRLAYIDSTSSGQLWERQHCHVVSVSRLLLWQIHLHFSIASKTQSTPKPCVDATSLISGAYQGLHCTTWHAP